MRKPRQMSGPHGAFSLSPRWRLGAHLHSEEGRLAGDGGDVIHLELKKVSASALLDEKNAGGHKYRPRDERAKHERDLPRWPGASHGEVARRSAGNRRKQKHAEIGDADPPAAIAMLPVGTSGPRARLRQVSVAQHEQAEPGHDQTKAQAAEQREDAFHRISQNRMVLALSRLEYQLPDPNGLAMRRMPSRKRSVDSMDGVNVPLFQRSM